MSRQVVKCPKCNYQESVISTRPGIGLPPCPRCDGFVRMADVTQNPDQVNKVWSTSGSQSADTVAPTVPAKAPAAPPPQRRDSRDYGPEPRV